MGLTIIQLTTFTLLGSFLATNAFAASLRLELDKLKSTSEDIQVHLPGDVIEKRDWFLPPGQITQGQGHKKNEGEMEDEVSLSVSALKREELSVDQRAQQLLNELEPSTTSGRYRSIWSDHSPSKQETKSFRSRSR